MTLKDFDFVMCESPAYLYVCTRDYTGVEKSFIRGKVYHNMWEAIDTAKEYASIPGYLSQVIVDGKSVYNSCK